MLREFKDFLMRGNIVELAVAFVIGVAFAAVVNSLVNDLIMPIIAMIIGKPDFSDLTFTINDAVFRYGSFITAVITFVAIAAAVFFFVVKPMQRSRRARQKDEESRLRRGAAPPGAARSAARAKHLGVLASDRASAAVGKRSAEALVAKDEPHELEPIELLAPPRRSRPARRARPDSRRRRTRSPGTPPCAAPSSAATSSDRRCAEREQLGLAGRPLPARPARPCGPPSGQASAPRSSPSHRLSRSHRVRCIPPGSRGLRRDGSRRPRRRRRAGSNWRR